jgi:hypothetical protein
VRPLAEALSRIEGPELNLGILDGMEDLVPKVGLHLRIEYEERLAVVLPAGMSVGPRRFRQLLQLSE